MLPGVFLWHACCYFFSQGKEEGSSWRAVDPKGSNGHGRSLSGSRVSPKGGSLQIKSFAKFAVLINSISVGFELAKDVIQQVTTQVNLDSVMLDYNILGRERFTEQLLVVCRSDNLPALKRSQIRVYEPDAEGMVRVEVRYTRQLRLLGYAIERKLVAKASIRQMEL